MPLSHTLFPRRQFFRVVGASSLARGFDLSAFADEKAPTPALAPLNRFPRTVQEFFVEQVRATERIGTEARAKLKTKADEEAYSS